MDFNDTPDEAAFRLRARQWLADNAGAYPAADRHRRIEPGSAALAVAKAWQAAKADAGFACIAWPKDWGGQGGSAIQQVIFNQEEAAYPVPHGAFHVGLGTCVPAILQLGDQATRDRFGPPAIRGDQVWCQLFSEPSGGSDLAGARTRAVRADDGSGDWIIDGQKTWTTSAQYADYGLIICRSDPDVPKHAGLTMFWLDMRTPGIEIRPIHQMSGRSTFNDTFLAGVRIPDSQRIGAIGGGWKASLVALMNERLAIIQADEPDWRDVLDLARLCADDAGATMAADPALREKIADWYVVSEGIRHTRNRAITALSRGEVPGPESSIIKLVLANHYQDLSHAAIETAGRCGIIDDPHAPSVGNRLHAQWIGSPGLRIAGGPDEIMKTIIAERILGLPGDLRVDKAIPFRDIPHGS
jgi:alkylation response protein AidB-like acyl-CoA dehydrogenase